MTGVATRRPSFFDAGPAITLGTLRRNPLQVQTIPEPDRTGLSRSEFLAPRVI